MCLPLLWPPLCLLASLRDPGLSHRSIEHADKSDTDSPWPRCVNSQSWRAYSFQGMCSSSLQAPLFLPVQESVHKGWHLHFWTDPFFFFSSQAALKCNWRNKSLVSALQQVSNNVHPLCNGISFLRCWPVQMLIFSVQRHWRNCWFLFPEKGRTWSKEIGTGPVSGQDRAEPNPFGYLKGPV